mmetsp:Transcript_16485/g.45442  ORF Transcript_16485/g.45442 Transcript_16485/m.45442 type:complete len:331 (-) Transcript_16485:277-1269(-)
MGHSLERHPRSVLCKSARATRKRRTDNAGGIGPGRSRPANHEGLQTPPGPRCHCDCGPTGQPRNPRSGPRGNQGGEKAARLRRKRTGRDLLVDLPGFGGRETRHSTQDWGSFCVWKGWRRSPSVSKVWSRIQGRSGCFGRIFCSVACQHSGDSQRIFESSRHVHGLWKGRIFARFDPIPRGANDSLFDGGWKVARLVRASHHNGWIPKGHTGGHHRTSGVPEPANGHWRHANNSGHCREAQHPSTQYHCCRQGRQCIAGKGREWNGDPRIASKCDCDCGLSERNSTFCGNRHQQTAASRQPLHISENKGSFDFFIFSQDFIQQSKPYIQY